MSCKPTTLVISPTPPLICLAAALRSHWSSLMIGGRKHIHALVHDWLQEGRTDRFIILLPAVRTPSALKAPLARLLAGGARIDWFATPPSASLRRLLGGMGGLRLIESEDLRAALARDYPLAPVDMDPDNRELEDYLRYKITLSFMRQLDAEPILEAVEVLRRNRAKRFDLDAAAPGDVQSVQHFRLNDFPFIAGKSTRLMQLKRRIVQVAGSSLSTLLVGHTGTGKEYAAFYLHEFSPRRAHPFVSINCAGLSEHFLRSELFGHCRGAFTGAVTDRKGLVEQAKGGTLFLDELGEMPQPIQADLLRFLQSRRYRRLGESREKTADVRLVAGAQPNLFDKLATNHFRPDLFYRLAEVQIHTPSLAEVPEDVFRIVRHACYRMDGQVEPKAIEAAIDDFRRGEATLRKYPWPGNVRELISLVRRRLQLGDDVIAELKERVRQGAPAEAPSDPARPAHPGRLRPLRQIEREYARAAFELRGALTVAETAARLGISENKLRKLIRPEGRD